MCMVVASVSNKKTPANEYLNGPNLMYLKHSPDTQENRFSSIKL
jgi:hypothetical protein